MPVDGFARNLAYKNSKRLSESISVKDFGAKGDGVTDDTAAIQAFVNYLTTNHCHGFLPTGNYLISSKINVKRTYGWGLRGAGQNATIITQQTNNTPILDLGATAGDQMYNYVIEDIGFTYTNVQPSTNTDANCIRFSQMGFEGNFNRLTFTRGSWAIKVTSGIGGPWGQDWDNLQFGSGLTGGAMDWTGATNAVPNNKWGRFFVDGANMVGPVFNALKGYNWTIGTIEMLSLTNAQWITLQAGAEVTIGALKLEVFTYNVAGSSFTGSCLFYAPTGAVQIGQVFMGGTTQVMAPTDRLAIFGGSVRNIRVELVDTGFTTAISNFSLTVATTGRVSFGRIVDSGSGSYPVPLANFGGTTAPNFVTYDWDATPRLSDNIGDANYTTTHGGANIIVAETALTASRTVEIMPDTNYMFNGRRYRIISRGAVNGANTLVIKAGGTTKATISADNYAVELVWRRNATAHSGWQIVSQGAA